MPRSCEMSCITSSLGPPSGRSWVDSPYTWASCRGAATGTGGALGSASCVGCARTASPHLASHAAGPCCCCWVTFGRQLHNTRLDGHAGVPGPAAAQEGGGGRARHIWRVRHRPRHKFQQQVADRLCTHKAIGNGGLRVPAGRTVRRLRRGLAARTVRRWRPAYTQPARSSSGLAAAPSPRRSARGTAGLRGLGPARQCGNSQEQWNS